MSELPPQFIELITPRFSLRTLQPGDACQEIESWTLDPLIAEMMNVEQKSWTIDRQRAHFTEGLTRPRRRVVGMFPASSTVPIGIVLLSLNASHGTFTISTLIGDGNWRGKDAASECSNALIDLLFTHYGFSKAKANVLPSNKAMLWLLAHSAWKREGRLREHLRNPVTGERMDVIVYGLLKAWWLEYVERTGGLLRRHQMEPQR